MSFCPTIRREIKREFFKEPILNAALPADWTEPASIIFLWHRQRSGLPFSDGQAAVHSQVGLVKTVYDLRQGKSIIESASFRHEGTTEIATVL